MSTTVNIHEAKTHLSRLLVEVAGGKEVIIAKNGIPLAKLISLTERKPRQPGRFQGLLKQTQGNPLIPMTAQELRLWEAGHAADPLLHSPKP
jgi:prevent-host-death family protein